jgi:hypothetical protein
LEAFLPLCTVGGSFFGPEMMLLSLMHKMQVIQIPVNYRPRVGRSSVTGSLPKALVLGFQMIWLIVTVRLNTWLKKPIPAAPAFPSETEVPLERVHGGSHR